MILEIKKDKDLVLRKKCQEIKDLSSIKELIFDMKQTMEIAGGVGLAASQVGELKRVIIVRFPGQDNSFALINPKIISKSFKKNLEKEGCLSFPGVFLDIKRAEKIRVDFLNEQGEKKSLFLQGLAARIVQHEVDHLDGIVFLKRLSFFQRRKCNF
ncbi:MAG: peptide deformylase [Candidatus Pacebacteria bacterium]|nr:peptide deformylase [Candidatus Paceibacterota bacterium]